MSKTRGIVLGANHVNTIGPRGGSAGEGFGAGNPPIYGGKSVGPNFNEPGIRTGPQGPGTAANSVRGNPDEASRVAFQGRYGVSPAAGNVDMNDPASNGDGVILDHMAADYASPKPAPQADGPVPRGAPVFDTLQIPSETAAHLGVGSGKTAPNPAMARDSLLKIGGVMSRD